MATYWQRLKSRLGSIWKGSFVETLEALIQNTLTSIRETSNVLLIFFKVLWVSFLVVILAIVLLFKRLYRLIRRLLTITLQELNFYATLMASQSKNLRGKWNDIFIVLADVKIYLADKIDSDGAMYSSRYNGKIWQLFLWDFPFANISWVVLFAVSLLMSIVLVISTLLIFPPILHRIVREAS
jgi:hypothetical protein